jgi:hypothetical protein
VWRLLAGLPDGCADESHQLQDLIDNAQLSQYYQEVQRLLAAARQGTDIEMQE